MMTLHSRTLPAAPSFDGGYARRVSAYFEGLAARLRERGVEHVAARTDRPVEEALVPWLHAR